VSAAQKVSKKTKSLSPINLAQDSFEESTPSAPSTSFVTPSVKKVAKRPPVTTSSNVVLSKNNGSNGEIVYVAHQEEEKVAALARFSVIQSASH
jgi:hypothetical protein